MSISWGFSRNHCCSHRSSASRRTALPTRLLVVSPPALSSVCRMICTSTSCNGPASSARRTVKMPSSSPVPPVLARRPCDGWCAVVDRPSRASVGRCRRSRVVPATRRRRGRAATRCWRRSLAGVRLPRSLGISRAAAYRLAASGELPVRRLGGRVYVVTAELQHLIAS
jgi:hypothetical protein